MALYQEILYEVDDPVATITLNRPSALNAWTDRMGAEVRHAVAAARERSARRRHRDHRRRARILRRRRHEPARRPELG